MFSRIPKGYVTLAHLQKRRKWTTGDIVEYLGKPDQVLEDSTWKTRIRLFSLERVKAAEAENNIGLAKIKKQKPRKRYQPSADALKAREAKRRMKMMEKLVRSQARLVAAGATAQIFGVDLDESD